MPRNMKGVIVLAVFLAAVWYAWTRFVRAKVK